MAKSKKKSTVSVGSNSSSNGSNSTNPVSNVSIASSSVVSAKSKSGKAKKSMKSKSTALPPRTPEPPVDLDEMVVSPAETFDTVPLEESPSRSFDSTVSYHKQPKKLSKPQQRNSDDDSAGNDYLPVSLLNFESPRKGNGNKNNGNSSKVVIEHKMKDSHRGNGSRSPFGMMCLLKPLLLFLFIAAMLSGAASVYGWLFKFPSLNKQVKELENQISRLEAENDRYESLNDQLNLTAYDLEEVKDDLNGTVLELENVASVLNTTTDQVVEVINQLKGQNYEYALLNEGLQDNVEELAGEVNFFREALEELSNEHSILQSTTDSLQELAAQFSDTTVDQKETLAVLKETLDGFQAENDRLEDFNEKLESGLDYLNETLFANGNLVESSAATLSDISEVLGERVQQQQQSTLVQLEISYRQLLAGWDCGFNDVFQFGQDSVIPSTNGNLLPVEVQTYLDDRVLSKLCLDFQDFEAYLSSTTTGGGVTSNQLVRAVVLYTEGAMKYYFDGTSNGVSLSEWIDASFQCDLLDSPFVAAQNGINVRQLNQLFYLRY